MKAGLLQRPDSAGSGTVTEACRWRLVVLPFRLDVQGISGASVGVVFSWMLRIQQRLVVVLHDAAVKCYQQLSTLITRPEGNVQSTLQQFRFHITLLFTTNIHAGDGNFSHKKPG